MSAPTTSRRAATRSASGPLPRLGRAAVIGQLLAALAFVGVLLAAEGVRLPFTGSGAFTLRAAFADAGGINGGERTPVLVSGVPVGNVTAVRLSGGSALVTMELGSGARGVIKRDATAAIEPRSALDDLTIDITPGSASAPAASSGMEIPVARTTSSTSLAQVISVLDADTRAQLSILIDQLARGTGGRGGQLGAAVRQLATLLNPATAVTAALANRRVLLARLVDSLARIGATAERHDLAIAGAVSAAATTLAATAREQTQVAASVQALPAAVRSIDHALVDTRALAQPLVPVLENLQPTASALAGALAAVRAFARPASTLLRAAGTFAAGGGAGTRAAASAMAELHGTAAALAPVITRLEPIVADVNARRAGIAQLGERFSGVLSTDDANGPILRGLGTFEPFNPADFGEPGASPGQRAKLAAQAAEALTLTCLHGQAVACLVRYLVPGLPGSVR
jgi:phospholipid/cholesterol/gamma-HCH transport system substrate-binding protein